jgi:hypothetical protein
VARICGSPKLAKEYDLVLALAEIQRQDNVYDAKHEKAQPPK